MARRPLFVAATLVLAGAAATPALTARNADRPESAPPGTSTTRYCMRVEPLTGSQIERIRCWTRAQWEEQGIDVDREWPGEGVRIID